MNGINYILDTNAIIYLLSGNPVMKQYITCRCGLSIISRMELLSYSGISEKEEKIINNFLNECEIFPINHNIEEKAIILRKKYKIKLPDAIVASTSICLGAPLITADKGFSKIKELNLELINPSI